VRGIQVHDDARRRHGDHHRRQRPISMSRRRAPLERLAKRGLPLVVIQRRADLRRRQRARVASAASASHRPSFLVDSTTSSRHKKSAGL